MNNFFLKCLRLCGDVKETRSAASAIEAISPEKVLLSVAGDLHWSASLDEVPCDSSPISFPNHLQSPLE